MRGCWSTNKTAEPSFSLLYVKLERLALAGRKCNEHGRLDDPHARLGAVRLAVRTLAPGPSKTASSAPASGGGERVSLADAIQNAGQQSGGGDAAAASEIVFWGSASKFGAQYADLGPLLLVAADPILGDGPLAQLPTGASSGTVVMVMRRGVVPIVEKARRAAAVNAAALIIVRG